jgi:hypothetical protein
MDILFPHHSFYFTIARLFRVCFFVLPPIHTAMTAALPVPPFAWADLMRVIGINQLIERIDMDPLQRD